jgi:hypothetical protein
MAQQRENVRYLPGYPFSPALQVSAQPLPGLLTGSSRFDLAIIASPMAGLRGLLTQLQDGGVPVAWLCKGFESSQDGNPGLLGHEVQAQVAPALRAGVLSGPSFAQEVAQGLPTALVAASSDAALRDVLVAAFHSPALRVYANDDVVGVEVGGAVKNVMAIATGLCDGLQLGLNARAALITRGLAEMTRLGLALGARAETFMGLSGLGDWYSPLRVTCRATGVWVWRWRRDTRWPRPCRPWAMWPKACTVPAPWCNAPRGWVLTCRSPAVWWVYWMAPCVPNKRLPHSWGAIPPARACKPFALGEGWRRASLFRRAH